MDAPYSNPRTAQELALSGRDGRITIQTEVVDRHHKELGLGGIAVYMILCDYINHETGIAEVTQKTLATRLDVSKNTISKHVRKMQELGLIKIMPYSKRFEGSDYDQHTYMIFSIRDANSPAKPVPNFAIEQQSESQPVPLFAIDAIPNNGIVPNIGTGSTNQIPKSGTGSEESIREIPKTDPNLSRYDQYKNNTYLPNLTTNNQKDGEPTGKVKSGIDSFPESQNDYWQELVTWLTDHDVYGPSIQQMAIAKATAAKLSLEIMIAWCEKEWESCEGEGKNMVGRIKTKTPKDPRPTPKPKTERRWTPEYIQKFEKAYGLA